MGASPFVELAAIFLYLAGMVVSHSEMRTLARLGYGGSVNKPLYLLSCLAWPLTVALSLLIGAFAWALMLAMKIYVGRHR